MVAAVVVHVPEEVQTGTWQLPVALQVVQLWPFFPQAETLVPAWQPVLLQQPLQLPLGTH